MEQLDEQHEQIRQQARERIMAIISGNVVRQNVEVKSA